MKYIYIVYFFQASRRSSTVPADPSRRLSVTERKFGYADLLEEIGVPRFLVEDETDADGDLSTVLVRCAVLPSLVANLLCTLCRKHTLSTPAVDRTAPHPRHGVWPRDFLHQLRQGHQCNSVIRLYRWDSGDECPICRGEISCVGNDGHGCRVLGTCVKFILQCQ